MVVRPVPSNSRSPRAPRSLQWYCFLVHSSRHVPFLASFGVAHSRAKITKILLRKFRRLPSDQSAGVPICSQMQRRYFCPYIWFGFGTRTVTKCCLSLAARHDKRMRFCGEDGFSSRAVIQTVCVRVKRSKTLEAPLHLRSTFPQQP